RAVDNPHAALPDPGFHAIGPEHRAARQLRRGPPVQSTEYRVFKRAAFGVQEPFHLLTQSRIGAAALFEKSEALLVGQFERGAEDLLDPRPALRGHRAALDEISTRSQALAMAHSRFTVRGAMASASAVSSTVMPQKYRISTTCACCASRRARRARASSTASSSSDCPPPPEISQTSISAGISPPPRLAATLWRA